METKELIRKASKLVKERHTLKGVCLAQQSRNNPTHELVSINYPLIR